MTRSSKFRRGSIVLTLAAIGIAPIERAQATVVNNLYAPAQVSFVYSYSEFGGGDVVFRLDTTLTGCEAGYWLRPTDPGFQRNVAMLMSAQLARRAISVHTYDDQIWSGSVSKYCRVLMIAMS
jgi:hypothetical protein